jgi:RNA 3'-terminal phosphate cyclase (ATP)
VSLDLKRRGYYPKGGGEVLVSVYPLLQGEKLRPISLLNKGKIKGIRGIAHYAKLPSHIGRDMKYGAECALEEAGYQIHHDTQPEDGEGVLVDILDDRESNDIAIAGGSGIVLWTELGGGGIIGGSAVGRKGLNAKGVGAEAAKELLRGLERGGCVDEWLQDQIVIFMALADGRSEVNCGKGELELHTRYECCHLPRTERPLTEWTTIYRTAIWLAEQMSDAKFVVGVDEVGNTILRCTGIGYTASAANPSWAA